jgi:hypothetical protein
MHAESGAETAGTTFVAGLPSWTANRVGAGKSYLPLKGLTISRAHSITIFETGFGVRCFSVITAIGVGFDGKSTGSTLRTERIGE